jgi:hypothetical protein
MLLNQIEYQWHNMLSITYSSDYTPFLFLNNVWPFSFTVKRPLKYLSCSTLIPLNNISMFECLVRASSYLGSYISASIYLDLVCL